MKIPIAFLLCLFSLWGQGIVTNLPAEFCFGNTYSVEIVIIRNSTSTSFSKFYLDLPTGILVKALDVAGGSFGFEPTQKRAKVVWASTPKTAELKIILMFEVTSNTEGKGEILMKYSFIDNEQKKEILAPPKSVLIKANSLAAHQSKNSEKFNIITEKENQKSSKDSESISEITTLPASKTQQYKIQNEVPEKEFKIQVLAASSPPDISKFRHLGKATIYEEGGLYKVMVGSFSDKEEALAKLREFKNKGINGFVVYFENGIKK
ncbi:MAG: SPOR domain-containing protein [Bacteroidia bacterium]|nr:SPOR domain-containing protein [Bacteroidia bacterium]